MGFATAEECAYNDPLCAAWAEGVYDMAITKGYCPPPATVGEVHAASTHATYVNKAILGCLPRGRKLLPVLSEFLQPQQFDISALPQVQTLALNKRIPDDCSSFPKGSKLLRFVIPNGGDEKESKFGLPTQALIGIPRSPMEFLRDACKLVHPTALAMSVGNLMLRNIDAYNDPAGLEFRRLQCEFSGKLVKMCADLRNEEAEIKDKMDLHVRQILVGKRIAVFKKLLMDIEHPDSKVADEMADGFPLCGWLPSSGAFPTKVRAPEIPEGFLRKMSESISARSIAATTSSGSDETDDKLWRATLDEVQDGFLDGPYKVSDLPKGCIVSPRFGLQQKNKLRPIDNFSASQVNAATGLQDKFVVDAVDEICAMIKAWIQRSSEGLKLVGKTYDMRKAYRQIAIRRDHLDMAWIVVWNPVDCSPALFKMRTMPFGATASVGAFLRLSQAIKSIGIASCGLVWSAFYDDYVCVCKEGTERQTDRMVRFLFKTLGWDLSEEPEKDKEFAPVFQALGVEFDLRSVPSGFFLVGNTSSRKEELKERMTDILKANTLEPAAAESLRSRLLFADSQIYGRFSKMALYKIGSIGNKRNAEAPLSSEVKASLEWFIQHVLSGPPRRISCESRETFYLFLDGACSEACLDVAWSGTSVGAVMADQDGKILKYFGHVIDENLVKTWGAETQVQHVFEAEVLPYALCLLVWGSILKGKCVFAFIDNEAAKASWISGIAYSRIARNVLHNGTVLEANLDIHPFFSRVPTYSNFGDEPSRGSFQRLSKLGAERTSLDDGMIRKLCTLAG